MRLPQRTKAETKRNKRNQTVRVIPSGFKLSEESRIFLFCGRTSIGGVAAILPTEIASFVALRQNLPKRGKREFIFGSED